MKEKSDPKGCRREGMTLVEILFSIAILTILFIMLGSALFYPQRVVTRSALKQNAIDAGTAVIEDLFAQDYADIDDYLNNLVVPYVSDSYAVNGQAVTVDQIEAEDPDPSDDEKLRHIRVEVSYPDDNTGDDTVVLETMRSSMYLP